MASIKVKFRYPAPGDEKGTIFYQIIHERKPRQLISKYRIYPSEWNEKRSIVIINPHNDRQSHLLSIREHIRKDVDRLAKIIRVFDSNGMPYTSEDVIDEFNRYMNNYSLFNYMGNLILKLRNDGKIRTSETYTAALNSFRKFRNHKDVMLDHLTSGLLESYEAWHRKRGNSLNTVSFYTRILRAVYNRAVEERIIENSYPFRHVYTGIEKTVKRALPIRVIKEIKSLKLSRFPSLDFARDMFIMSFMLRGMSFIDMAFLKKNDLSNGYIVYKRHKTGQQLIIEWTKDMQKILDKYPKNKSIYLLPIIRNPGTNERYTYRNVGYNINHNLKTIAKKIGITIPLTLYVARHSWASAAKEKGIPLSVISEGMGHESEKTTRIYLASLDTSLIDKANSIILKSI